MSTTPAPQASLAAPMLVLLGPVVTLVASFVASAGQPLLLVEEAGTLAFVAVGASFVVTPCVAALFFTGSRGGSRWPALAAPLALVPWVFMALALVLGVLGAGLVVDAVSHADPASQLVMMGAGGSEVMASRMLGAALMLGGALALSAAMLALALTPRAEGTEARVPGSGLAALVLLGVAAVALVVLVDATVLRRGLSAAAQAEAATRAALLGQTLLEARSTHFALLTALALTTLLGSARRWSPCSRPSRWRSTRACLLPCCASCWWPRCVWGTARSRWWGPPRLRVFERAMCPRS